VPVLQWHVLGDVLKVMSWPLGILILAAGDAKMLVVTEAAAVCMYVLATWLGLPYLGVQATGVAFVAMYALHLPLTFWLAKRRTGMAWPGRLWWQFLTVLAGCGAIFATSAYSKIAGASVGIVVCTAASVYAAARIGHLMVLGGAPGKVAGFCQRFLRSVGVSYG
jgi:PST family polysaccharide transporter